MYYISSLYSCNPAQSRTPILSDPYCTYNSTYPFAFRTRHYYLKAYRFTTPTSQRNHVPTIRPDDLMYVTSPLPPRLLPAQIRALEEDAWRAS